MTDKSHQCVIVGIAGASASGKSLIASTLYREIRDQVGECGSAGNAYNRALVRLVSHTFLRPDNWSLPLVTHYAGSGRAEMERVCSR